MAKTYKDREIVIFSDDIDWCIKTFHGMSWVSFHKGSSALDDFLALSQFSSYVLLGSSFSWWSAFLFSDSNTEMIVSPSKEVKYNSMTELNKLSSNVRYKFFRRVGG
ncbi:hypothetical protein BZG13_14570 [Salinivibrio sp. ML323]|nr:hypothetical protein BZG13_14570 [Salinivibrio sp. ML323]